MKIQRIHFETIDSTNTWAKTHLDELDKDVLTLVTADEQTAGRGRWRRKWVAPKGVSITASYCFFLDSLKPDLGNIPQVLSISAANILRLLGFPVLIKWPNDLILEGKKLGGILCETGTCDKRVGVVVGIGINVNMELTDLEGIDRPAISLLSASGKQWDVEDVQEKLTNQFHKDLMLFLRKGFGAFCATYKSLSSLIQNNPIVVNIYPQKYTGHFHSLNDDGSLVITDPEGQLKTFNSGEILE